MSTPTLDVIRAKLTPTSEAAVDAMTTALVEALAERAKPEAVFLALGMIRTGLFVLDAHLPDDEIWPAVDGAIAPELLGKRDLASVAEDFRKLCADNEARIARVRAAGGL